MKVRKVPRGTFWIGAFAAVAVALPLTSYALLFLARRLHIGELTSTLERNFILSAIFAGFPTLLAGGGVARFVAHRVAEGAEVRAGMIKGVLAMGVAGIGTVLLTAVPVGGLPERAKQWVPQLFGTGLAIGMITGLAIGVLTALRQKRHSTAMPWSPS